MHAIQINYSSNTYSNNDKCLKDFLKIKKKDKMKFKLH